MNKFYKVVRFFCMVFSVLWLSFSANAAVEVGKPAPDFQLVNEKGQAVSLSGLKGKFVILEWTNHECPFVKKHYGAKNMQTLQNKYTKEGVVWLSIISSAPGKQGFVSADEAKALSETRSATPSHILFDPKGEVGRMYDAKTTPHMYIIDKEGVLQYNGGIDSIPSANPADIGKAENYLDSAFAELKAGKSVSKSLTRPYGCSVKYAK